jgi:hypothetical protein
MEAFGLSRVFTKVTRHCSEMISLELKDDLEPITERICFLPSKGFQYFYNCAVLLLALKFLDNLRRKSSCLSAQSPNLFHKA